MQITIKTIPHKKQRYATCGDWIVEDGNVNIFVSELGDWREEMLIAYHELREALLCIHRGILQELVDAFDREYEQNREKGDTSEPGDNRNAPYFMEHQLASRDELLLAHDLGVDWEKYGEHIDNL